MGWSGGSNIANDVIKACKKEQQDWDNEYEAKA
jgi:hypothetical protein